MKWNDILPLGSTILLKGSEPIYRIEIIGYAQVRAEDQQFFDYAGVFYSHGYENGDKVVLFNHEDVDIVYSIGYMDDEMRKYCSHIKTLIEDIRTGKVDISERIKNAEERFGKVIK